MSDTPRTDAFLLNGKTGLQVAEDEMGCGTWIEFARQLERELAYADMCLKHFERRTTSSAGYNFKPQTEAIRSYCSFQTPCVFPDCLCFCAPQAEWTKVE
jgi:hypothetical protein